MYGQRSPRLCVGVIPFANPVRRHELASPAESSPGGSARRQPRLGAVRAWLWTVAGLVFLMVVVGGATRLTESGRLSHHRMEARHRRHSAAE